MSSERTPLARMLPSVIGSIERIIALREIRHPGKPMGPKTYGRGCAAACGPSY
jgi:hypothetical protein